jgi:membrane protein DedA with SNARE-associated domain
MFDFVQQHITSSPLTYLLIVGVCTGDALFPLFPSEAVVITAGVLAANGRLEITFVVLASWAGAVTGDNCAYGLGRSGLKRLANRLLGSEPNQKRLQWARDQLRVSGAWIIIVVRFIPGGRTATTYVAGTLELPWKRRFLPADTVAGLLWSLFSAGLGYFGGAAFEDNLLLPLLIAAGASVVVAGVGEIVRRKLLDRRT